jgi:hypothetical protein
MNMKRVGFFFEMPMSERVATVRAIRRAEPQHDEANILKYLEAGAAAAAVPGVEEDVLADPPRIIGPMHIRTDGIWAWPETLAYYVRIHHIALPEEFVQHMRANGWSCPHVAPAGRLNLEGHVTIG